jgi:hypothetical protein
MAAYSQIFQSGLVNFQGQSGAIIPMLLSAIRSVTHVTRARVEEMTLKREHWDRKLGSRFQLTRLGIERCSKCGGRAGVVVGFSRANGSIRVLFDGTKTPRSLHRTYIESIDLESHSPVAV